MPDCHMLSVSVAVIVLSSSPATADEIISNLPGDDRSQTAAVEGGRIKAVGFTMPAGSRYTLDRADIRLAVRGLAIDPLIRIFDDVGGVPTNELIELIDPPITALGIATYSFTAPAPLVLEGGQTYWLVVYNVGDISMDWKGSSGPMRFPTGIAAHAGALFETGAGPSPPTVPTSIINSYAIHGTPADGCSADCDASGALDFFDFLCFQNLFAAGDPTADCDESGGLDFFDFLCFQNAFAAGCP